MAFAGFELPPRASGEEWTPHSHPLIIWTNLHGLRVAGVNSDGPGSEIPMSSQVWDPERPANLEFQGAEVPELSISAPGSFLEDGPSGLPLATSVRPGGLPPRPSRKPVWAGRRGEPASPPPHQPPMECDLGSQALGLSSASSHHRPPPLQGAAGSHVPSSAAPLPWPGLPSLPAATPWAHPGCPGVHTDLRGAQAAGLRLLLPSLPSRSLPPTPGKWW